MKLSHDFYNRSVVEVAQDLLGKKFIWGTFEGIITETEAYAGLDDAASHAARGITPRSKVMFGPPGYVYVYLVYGVYHCLNIVTDAPGTPSAVLIRGIKLVSTHLDGPGKVCRHLNINTTHNNLNLVTHAEAYLMQGITPISYSVTPRIGIKKAMDKPWRFVISPGEVARISVAEQLA